MINGQGGTVFIRVTMFDALSDVARNVVRGTRLIFSKVLAERQIIVRTDGRVRAVTLGWRTQSLILILAIATGGWFVHASIARIESGRIIAEKNHEIGTLKLAYRSFKNDVDRSETRFKALARTLEAKHAYLMALLGPEALGPDAPKVLGDETPSDVRERVQATRNELLAQLGKLEMVMQVSARSEGEDARARVEVEERLRLQASERVRLDHDRRALVSRIEKLEDRLAALNRSQHTVAARMADRAIDRVGKVKKLIASAGINVDRLLDRLSGNTVAGVGGPFIAASPGNAGTNAVPASLSSLDHNFERLDDLRKLARFLPLATPSDHFYVASGFGKRRDPMNGRWAMHYGLDLAGIYRSPVLATAPGVVVAAGWNGNYGRMVEIDHGFGIHTRYGHLHRILVKKGQKVDLREEIGEMGSSGRSTGTHVHYEVLVNGKPKDPMKFIEAGEHVFKGL